MWEQSVTSYLQDETDALLEWAKCGDSLLSSVPTVLWAVGTAALAHRMLAAIFRRFLFRRVPVWELILQVQAMHLLFLWMVIYSLHFWVLFVKVIKVFVDYCYDDVGLELPDELALKDASRHFMQQWVVWIFGVMPLAFYIHTRPRPDHQPLMIWITTSPWQRREMGPYGYYLSRPLSPPAAGEASARDQMLAARPAFSDSRIVAQPVKKKRHSKSV